MSEAYAAGNKALGNCDRCGFQYRLKKLKPQVVDLLVTGLLVCPECLDKDQPQLQLGRWPVNDPQALRNPRPMGQDGGRVIPYGYRTDFETGLDGWAVENGNLTWNSSTQTATLVSDETSVNPGDPYMIRKSNSTPPLPDIDASVYRHITVMFRVNRFPEFEPDDRYKDDFQGHCFFEFPWSTPSSVRVSPLPVFSNSPTGVWTKATWSMASNPLWTGTVDALRFDFFDARNSEGTVPDYDAGEIEISYIAVEDWSAQN